MGTWTASGAAAMAVVERLYRVALMQSQLNVATGKSTKGNV
jgi:hypothetical protein